MERNERRLVHTEAQLIFSISFISSLNLQCENTGWLRVHRGEEIWMMSGSIKARSSDEEIRLFFFRQIFGRERKVHPAEFIM